MGEVSIVGSIVKVLIVFGLLFLTLKAVARLNGPRVGGGRVRGAQAAKPVEVLGRTALGRNAAVAVVRLGERCFALGVTDQKVNLLTEVEIDLTEEPVNPVSPPPAGTQGPGVRPSWRELVESLRERTVRH